MPIGSIVAVYFVAWWITFVAVVPMGSTSLHEAGGDIEKGHEPGAPVAPKLIRKALLTSVIAAVVTVGLLYMVNNSFVADYWNR